MQTRREALALLGGAAALTMAGPVRAQAKPIRIGVLTDMTGMLADATGQGSVTAAKLAAKSFGSTVAGRPVEILTGDHQNRADVGAALARRWFDEDGVDAIADVGNSAVALAVVELAREHNRVLLATAPMSSDLTGTRCSPNTVQWSDNYLMASTLTKSLLGQGLKSWYFLTSDYSFGHDLQRIATGLIESGGGKVIGSVRHPIGTSDYLGFLMQAQASGAQVVALASAGTDPLNAIKQAREMGLNSVLAGFVTPISAIHGLGLEQATGLFVGEPFYWDHDEKTRAFAKDYFAIMGRHANYSQAAAYSAVGVYLSTINRAPHLAGDGRAIVAEMKRQPIDDPLYGRGRIRADGRFVHRSFLYRVKSPKESRYPWDYYDLVTEVKGDEVALPLDRSGCPILDKMDI